MAIHSKMRKKEVENRAGKKKLKKKRCTQRRHMAAFIFQNFLRDIYFDDSDARGMPMLSNIEHSNF